MQRELLNSTRVSVCPSCGGRLAQENELLVCTQHGAFFSYGPHLLVRVPDKSTPVKSTSLPWEMSTRSLLL